MEPIFLRLDTRINNYASIDLMQGYNYTLEAHITDNYKDVDLTGVTVQMQMQKPDKKFIIQTENIVIEGNKIKATLDKDFTREDGQAKLQVVLFKDDFTFGSWVIKAKIKPSAINDNDGQSENKVTITEALVNKINEAENTKIELDKSIANGDVATIKGNVDNIKDVEIPKINEQLDNIANKGTTVEVLERVTKEEIDRQIADGTIANLTIQDNSITNSKYKEKSVTISKLSDDANFIFNELLKSGNVKLNISNISKTYEPPTPETTDRVSSIRVPFLYKNLKYKYFIFPKFNAEENTSVRISIKDKDKETILFENTNYIKKGDYENYLFDGSAFNWDMLNYNETYYFCIESLENKYLNYSMNISGTEFSDEVLNSVNFLYDGVDFNTYKMGITLEHTGWYYYDFNKPNKIPCFYLCSEYPYVLNLDESNTENKNIFDGKSALFFGDSTCAGSGGGIGGWQKIIQNNNPKMITRNCGMYGGDWWQAYNKWFTKNGDGEPLPDSVDYVVIQSFVNGLITSDTPLAKPIGSIPLHYPSNVDEDFISRDEHCATMEKFIFALTEKYPNAKFLFVISYKMVDMLKENSNYVKMIPNMYKVCDKYSIKVLDLFRESGIQCYSQTQIDRWFWNSDGVHIDLDGYKKITPKIENTMRLL